jgi:hypothetical protein
MRRPGLGLSERYLKTGQVSLFFGSDFCTADREYPGNYVKFLDAGRRA